MMDEINDIEEMFVSYHIEEMCMQCRHVCVLEFNQSFIQYQKLQDDL